MITIKLKAENKSQELILAYLQENASLTLANKINNGVKIVKDGKQLLNKKDLKGFMSYATGEARKLAAKSETAACIEDSVVYGWAIHYFEEDSIEGTLFNEDGTQYKPIAKTKSPTPPVKVEPQKPKATQATLFDMLSSTSESAENDDEDEDEDDGEELNDDYTPEELQELADEEQTEMTQQANDHELMETSTAKTVMPKQAKAQPLYEHYLAIQKQHPDSVVFLRMGDFYEALGDKAITVAEPLNLTITGRDFGLKERVPMVGIPYHAFDAYLAKLIKANFKIAVAEDLNNITIFPQYEEEVEELTEAQMREFDSYVDKETGEILPPRQVNKSGEIENDECTEMSLEDTKAFDSEALAILYELFDGEITLA